MNKKAMVFAGAAALGAAAMGRAGRRAQKSDARLEKELRLAQWAAGFPYPYDMALERRYLPGGMGVTLDSRKWAENADLDEMYYGSSQLRGDEIVVARIYNHDDLGGGVVYSDLIIDLGAGTVRRTGGRGKAINYRDRNRVGWESVDEYDFARQVDAEGDASLDSISREVSRGLFNRAPVSGRSARGRRAEKKPAIWGYINWTEGRQRPIRYSMPVYSAKQAYRTEDAFADRHPSKKRVSISRKKPRNARPVPQHDQD